MALDLHRLPGIINPEQVAQLCSNSGLDPRALLDHLLDWGKEFASPPISHYHVGAAGLGASGRIYMGFNIEFEDRALHHTVHAEQAMVALAMGQCEPRLVALAVSSAPCGHCRQFLNETYQSDKLQVSIRDRGCCMTLSELLPQPFGPEDMNMHVSLLNSPRWPLHHPMAESDPAVAAALEAACISYAPYSNCPAGMALETTSGAIFAGSYAENAAFNPSMHPFQAALAHLIAYHENPADVRRGVLVQVRGKVNLDNPTRNLMECVAAHIPLESLEVTL